MWLNNAVFSYRTVNMILLFEPKLRCSQLFGTKNKFSFTCNWIMSFSFFTQKTFFLSAFKLRCFSAFSYWKHVLMVFSWAKLAFFSFIVRKTTFVLFLLLNYPVLSFFAQNTCFRSYVATLRRFQRFCGNILFLFLLDLRCFQLYLTVNNVFGVFLCKLGSFWLFAPKVCFCFFWR